MADLIIKQVRSVNGTNPAQRETLRSLSLGRIGRSTAPGQPRAAGMLNVVSHLVEVEATR